MTIQIERLSARELDALISKAKKRKTVLGKRKPAATVRRKLVALAKSEGYGIEELFGAAKGAPKARKAAAPRKATKKKVAPKYRNPANPKETWTGRGKQPRWMAALTTKGRKPDDFLIK
ncbi:MAG: H-NS histone family protein [Lysobacteraceae bacterium]|nr:MAG: H-NS histone family protein [Xanthomonadaceae bacterium]